MWLYIPLTPAQEQECSDSESMLPWDSIEYEPYVMLSRKAEPRPISWRGWRTRPWIQRLSGMMLKPCAIPSFLSTFSNSVLSSCAPDTPVSRSAQQGNAVAKRIRDIYGRGCLDSLRRLNPNACFSRTSQDTFQWDSDQSSEISKEQATALRQDCSRRQKLAQAIAANDSSSWATPLQCRGAFQDVAAWEKRGGKKVFSPSLLAYDAIPKDLEKWAAQEDPRRRFGTPLNLQATCFPDVPKMSWSTPRANKEHTEDALKKMKRIGSLDLPEEATTWPTPVARDYKTSVSLQAMDRRRASHLNNFASNCLPPALQSMVLGPEQSNSTRALNPRFAEWLMGWIPGLTQIDCVLSETEYAHYKRRMLSCLWRLVWRATNE